MTQIGIKTLLISHGHSMRPSSNMKEQEPNTSPCAKAADSLAGATTDFLSLARKVKGLKKRPLKQSTSLCRNSRLLKN